VFKLNSDTAYEGFIREWPDLTLKEISGFEIVSMAVVNGQKLKGKNPAPGRWVATKDGRLLWTGQNQYFLFSDSSNDRLDEDLSEKHGANVYCTLQTDGWASLEISGSSIHDVLERFIPLDIRSWAAGHGARTSAHHMSVFILKTGDDTYEIYTPRSSSATLLESLIHVIENVS